MRPGERENLDRLYETALAERPDFTHYRSRSAFAEAQDLGIDRNAYARIIHALEMIERGTYRSTSIQATRGAG